MTTVYIASSETNLCLTLTVYNCKNVSLSLEIVKG